jgi:hypothetical protein
MFRGDDVQFLQMQICHSTTNCTPDAYTQNYTEVTERNSTLCRLLYSLQPFYWMSAGPKRLSLRIYS